MSSAMFCDRARTALPQLWRLAPEALRAGRDHALNYVQWLPEELIAPVFDFLEFQHLLVASQVCAQWRRLAHDHVNFWRHVKLDSVDMRKALLALRRLAAGRGRPAILEVEYEGENSLVETCLINTLAAFYYSLRELTVKLHSHYAEALWRVLSLAAPELRYFQIDLDIGLPDPERPPPPVFVPIGVFESLSTTKLKRLVLSNMLLPDDGAMVSLRSVEDVSWFFVNVRFPFPSSLFTLFPEMRRLRLRGHSVVLDPLPDPVRRQLCALEYFEARLTGDRDLDFVRHLNQHSWLGTINPGLRVVPEMLVLIPNEDALYDTLEDLLSPFQLLIHAEPPSLTLSVRSLLNMRVRHFAQSVYDYASMSPRPNTLLVNHYFTQGQVVSLAVSSSTWTLIRPFLPPFPVLTSLILTLDGRQPGGHVALPALPLDLPSLEVLTLESRIEFAIVDIEDLVVFKRHVTGERRVKLYAINVQFEGKRRALRKEFKVIMQPPKDAYLRAPNFNY